MKKIISILAVLVLTASFYVSVFAMQIGQSGTYEATLVIAFDENVGNSGTASNNSEIKVIVNGTTLSFTQAPVIKDDSTLVPLRGIFEALNVSVEWNGDSQLVTATRGDKTIRTQIGKKQMAVITNGVQEIVEIDIAPIILNGSTMIPLRAVAQSFGAEVSWDGDTRTVTITTSDNLESPKTDTTNTNTTNTTPVSSITIASNLKKGMTEEEFNQAYAIACSIASKYAGLSKEEQLEAIFAELRYLTEAQLTYSDTDAHYSDVYGFFVLNRASCAGATRAVGLCLNILGIEFEHVNENQWSHQWCRVEVNGKYWICDAYGYYVGEEPGPYQHPWIA